jgi:hypothetical protein
VIVILYIQEANKDVGGDVSKDLIAGLILSGVIVAAWPLRNLHQA